MKTLAAILALLFLATPAFAKTECSSKSSPSAHYRLIDGKRCWYKGANLNKSQLTWRLSNESPTQSASVLPSRVDDRRDLTPSDLASLERSVDRLALCGAIDWGVCANHFDDRWRVK